MKVIRLSFSSFIYFIIILIIVQIKFISLLEFSLNRHYKDTESNSTLEEYFPYAISLKMGNTQNNTYYLTFDTATEYTWVGNNSNLVHSPYESSTYTKLTDEPESYTSITKIETTGLKISDTISFDVNDKQINNTFNFLLIDSSSTHTHFVDDGTLGIIKDYMKNPKFSFLNFLIENKIDDITENNKNFALIQKDKNLRKLVIGEKSLKKHLSSNKNLISNKCLCSSESSYFNCKILSYTFNKVTYDISNSNEYGIFSTGYEYITLPKKQGEKILDMYIKYLAKKKIKCKVIYTLDKDLNKDKENFKQNFTTLFCKKFDYEKLPDLSIDLDSKKDIRITAISDDLFKNFNKSHVLFKVIYFDNDETNWIFGEPFIKNYNLLFDFTGSGSVGITPSNIFNFYFLVVVIGAGVLILIIFLFLIYCVYRNAVPQDIKIIKGD